MVAAVDSGDFGLNRTVARSVPRLTDAWRTSGILTMARSTRPTQAAQVIPRTWNSTVLGWGSTISWGSNGKGLELAWHGCVY
jgi:hypothetical protein